MSSKLYFNFLTFVMAISFRVFLSLSLIDSLPFDIYDSCKKLEQLNTSVLVGDQLAAQFLLQYVYLNPLHVSSNSVLILRRTIVLIQHLV